jgi:hypothetical protein
MDVSLDDLIKKEKEENKKKFQAKVLPHSYRNPSKTITPLVRPTLIQIPRSSLENKSSRNNRITDLNARRTTIVLPNRNSSRSSSKPIAHPAENSVKKDHPSSPNPEKKKLTKLTTTRRSFSAH